MIKNATTSLTEYLNNYDESNAQIWKSALLDLEGHMWIRVLHTFVQDCVNRQMTLDERTYTKEFKDHIMITMSRYNDLVIRFGREGHPDYTEYLEKFSAL